MIAVIQRVKRGEVKVKDKYFSKIGKGYVILLGIFESDKAEDTEKLAQKIFNLRVMSDAIKR